MGAEGATALDRTTSELGAMLAAAWEVEVGAIDPDAPLRSLGVDSSTLVVFLSRVEVEYGMDWDTDVPASALSTVRSIAALIVDAGRARG